MYEDKFCQSCGMPMGITDEHYGTNEDGTKSEDYCHYCFENGKFTKEVSMAEMMDKCVQFMIDDKISAQQARKMIEEQFPNLKRWSAANSEK